MQATAFSPVRPSGSSTFDGISLQVMVRACHRVGRNASVRQNIGPLYSYIVTNLIINTTNRLPNTPPETNKPFFTGLLLLCLPINRLTAICNTIIKSSLSNITKPVTGVPLGTPYSSSRYSNAQSERLFLQTQAG
jgi:hypothetical protein